MKRCLVSLTRHERFWSGYRSHGGWKRVMIYKIIPRRYKEKISEWIKFSGSKMTPKKFFNFVFLLSIVLSLVVALLVPAYFFIMWLGVFIALFGIFHGFLALAVDRRAKFVETILPDALQLMAANSRAGYIPSRALLLSARKEFGPLSDAIKTASKELLTGESLEESLESIPKYIKSEVLERTVKLIIEGTRAGGQFAALLEENANNIRNVQVIRKEIHANIMMYTIFIGFAGIIGAPVLYALSTFLISTISTLGSVTEVPEAATTQVSFMSFGGLDLSPEFLFGFSIAAILVTSVFGAIIIGLIGSGKEKTGIKYVPIFAIAALLVFFVARALVGSIFGALMVG